MGWPAGPRDGGLKDLSGEGDPRLATHPLSQVRRYVMSNSNKKTKPSAVKRKADRTSKTLAQIWAKPKPASTPAKKAGKKST